MQHLVCSTILTIFILVYFCTLLFLRTFQGGGQKSLNRKIPLLFLGTFEKDYLGCFSITLPINLYSLSSVYVVTHSTSKVVALPALFNQVSYIRKSNTKTIVNRNMCRTASYIFYKPSCTKLTFPAVIELRFVCCHGVICFR